MAFTQQTVQSLQSHQKHEDIGLTYFQERKLRLADVKTIFSHPYDLILIGSDQVWRKEYVWVRSYMLEFLKEREDKRRTDLDQKK